MRISGSVAERDGQTVTLHGAEAFAAALDKAGIAVVRVTAADIQALDGLRRDEEFARLASDVGHEARKSRHFDKLEVGELAAVDKRGNVYRLNPHRLDLEDIEARLIDATKSSSMPTPTSSTLPGIIEARAGFAIKREQTAQLWQDRRAENARASALRSQNRAEETSARSVDRATRTTIATAERTLFKAARGGFSAAAAALGTVAKAIEGLFDFLSGPTAPPTKEEAQGMQRAADERQAEAADFEAQQEREAVRDWQQHAQKTQQQEADLQRGTITREASLNGDDRERERGLER